MLEEIAALAAAVDEEERFPEESLKALTREGFTAPGDTAEAVKVISDTARVCGSTAACLAAIFAAGAGVSGIEGAEAAAKSAARGKPVSVCSGELKVGTYSGECTLSGRLLRAPFVGFAQHYVVILTAEDAPREAFLVSGGAKGLKAGTQDEKLGLRGLVTGALYFENTPALPLGVNAAREAERCRWLYMAAVASGLLLGGIDEAISHAYRRVQFGKRISQFENTRFVLSRLITEARAAEVLLEKAADLRDAGGDWTTDAAMAKLACTDAACRGIRQCVQIMSGRGYSRDLSEEVKLRDAKTAEVFFGTPDSLMNFVADMSGIN